MRISDTTKSLLVGALLAQANSSEASVEPFLLTAPGKNVLTKSSNKTFDIIYSEPIPGFLERFSWNNASVPASGYCPSGFESIDNAVISEMRRSQIPGCSVALVSNGKLLYQRGFGFADLESKERFSPYTAVRCASVSKSFIACAVLKLAETGKLSLSDPALAILQRKDGEIGKIPKDSRVSKITVQDLLDHTSGFRHNAHFTADGRVALWAGNKGRSESMDIVRYALATETLNYEPGSSHTYSNLNYVLLGEILKITSNKSLEDAVRSLVLDPMGISMTDAYVTSSIASYKDPKRKPNEAHHYEKVKTLYPSYLKKREKATEAFGGLDLEAIAAPSGFSVTSEGLSRFISGLQGRVPFFSRDTWSDILSPPSYANRDSNRFPNKGHFYSDGFTVHLYRGVPQLEHGGLLAFSGAYFGPVDSSDPRLKGVTMVILVSSNDVKGPFYEMRLKKAVEGGLSAVRS